MASFTWVIRGNVIQKMGCQEHISKALDLEPQNSAYLVPWMDGCFGLQVGGCFGKSFSFGKRKHGDVV